MRCRSDVDRTPPRLLNECSFCHSRGLRPGILEIEFPADPRTRERFYSFSQEMAIDSNGLCGKCADTISCASGRNP